MNTLLPPLFDAAATASGAFAGASTLYLIGSVYTTAIAALATSLFLTTLASKAIQGYDMKPFERLKRSAYHFTTQHPTVRWIVAACLFVPGKSVQPLRVAAGVFLGLIGGATADTFRYYHQIQNGR